MRSLRPPVGIGIVAHPRRGARPCVPTPAGVSPAGGRRSATSGAAPPRPTQRAPARRGSWGCPVPPGSGPPPPPPRRQRARPRWA